MTVQSAPGADDAHAPEVDWRDPQVIRAEWENDSQDDDWGNALAMFDDGPVVGQRLNVADYMTRRLKFVLLGRSDLSDEVVAEVCRRILVLLSQPVLDWQEEFVPRLVRLPLALMRDRGWQSPKYGGDGTVAVDLDVRPVANAVATSLAPAGDYLGYFFGSVGGSRGHEPRWTFRGQSGIAFDQAWSPTSDRLVVAGLDRALRVWDLHNGEPVLSIAHPELISCVRWSSDGRHLVGGSSAGELLVVDAVTGEIVQREVAHADEVRSVAWSLDGTRIASGANDGIVRISRSADLLAVCSVQAHTPLVRSVSWSPDGKSIASGGHDGVVRVWDSDSGEGRGSLSDHQAFVSTVSYSPDGRLLASASADATVRIWDLPNRVYLHVLDDFDQWSVEDISFAPDGRYLATIDQSGTVRVLGLDTGEVVSSMRAGSMNKSISWSPDGKWLASGGPGAEQVWA